MESLVLTARKQLRIMDFCSLFAENRLVLALPQADREGTQNSIGRILKSLPPSLTFQWGVASYSPEEWIHAEELFAQAEKELALFPLNSLLTKWFSQDVEKCPRYEAGR